MKTLNYWGLGYHIQTIEAKIERGLFTMDMHLLNKGYFGIKIKVSNPHYEEVKQKYLDLLEDIKHSNITQEWEDIRLIDWLLELGEYFPDSLFIFDKGKRGPDLSIRDGEEGCMFIKPNAPFRKLRGYYVFYDETDDEGFVREELTFVQIKHVGEHRCTSNTPTFADGSRFLVITIELNRVRNLDISVKFDKEVGNSDKIEELCETIYNSVVQNVTSMLRHGFSPKGVYEDNIEFYVENAMKAVLHLPFQFYEYEVTNDTDID